LVTVPEDDANDEVNPQEALEEEYTDSLMEIVRLDVVQIISAFECR
jgi:hypothetical protein